ncbi:MAG: hypothetical protein LBU58_08000 [Clostridiales bacterium]|jgi:DNA-directed RNA polymerase subunit RPC12/RpoP|nr:hypothetical protein [Clostridiales bacterium]
MAESESFSCPSCGGGLVFDPETQSLKCTHCGFAEPIAQSNSVIVEHDFASRGERPEDLAWSQTQIVIKCDSCGAETVLEQGVTSAFCAFCGSPHVVPEREGDPGIRPESVLPFQISLAQAKDIFTRWIASDLLAPGNLKRLAQSEKLSGVYTPSWTFDADTRSSFTAQAGTHYYETVVRHVTVNGKRETRTETVQKTHWRPVSGSYSRFFDDVTVPASRNVPERYATSVLVFDYTDLRPYDAKFLSGFSSERYGVGIDEGWDSAKEAIGRGIVSGITEQVLAQHHCDVVAQIHVRTDYNDVQYKLLLAPLWRSAFRYMNRTFTYLINGQSGRIVGKRPKSPFKVALLVLAALAVAFVVISLANRYYI